MAYMVAYSENMCADFMQSLCPSARLKLKCHLIGCRLVLRRIYAGAEFSIERGTGEDSVPAVVWEIDEAGEKDLMGYYPEGLYEKVCFSLRLEKVQIEVFMLRKLRRRMRNTALISGMSSRRWTIRRTA